VQVTGTANAGEVLGVATSVTLGVVGVEAGGGVQGLMDVTNVMDDHAESEGSAITILGEVLGDLLPVVGSEVIITGSFEPLGQVSEGTNNVVLVHHEQGVVVEGVAVDGVGLIDEVPSSLEGVDTLNVVGEGGTLSEGVVDLTGDQGGVGNLEGVQFSESSLQHSGVLFLEEGLGLCGN